MTLFTINPANDITAHAGVPSGADESQTFRNQKDLAALAANWPAARLVEVWNGFAGVPPFGDLKPVKKFTDRKAAVKRIWDAIQALAKTVEPATVGKRAAHVAPAKGKATKDATTPKPRATGRKIAHAKDGSKKSEVIAMMRSKDGASIEAIMKATGWQRHTIRGLVSGTLVKRMGLKIESFRAEGKERRYRISE